MASLGGYVGQSRKARDLAVKELGAEKVAFMDDNSIVEWIEDNYAIFWGDKEEDFGRHIYDEEIIALVPNEVYRSIRESIVFLER